MLRRAIKSLLAYSIQKWSGMNGEMMLRVKQVTGVILFLTMVLVAPSYSQLAGANLSGLVKDNSGAGIPSAKISIRNIATDDVREVQSNSDGLYSAPNLSPGIYELTVVARGFSTLVERAVSLTVGSERTLDVTLKLGELSQKIKVNSSAPTVVHRRRAFRSSRPWHRESRRVWRAETVCGYSIHSAVQLGAVPCRLSS